jgi:hypothetical protein
LPFVLRRRQNKRSRSNSSRPASPPTAAPTIIGVLFGAGFEELSVVEPASEPSPAPDPGSAVPELEPFPPELSGGEPAPESEPEPDPEPDPEPGPFVAVPDAVVVVGLGVVCVSEKMDASTTNCGTSSMETIDAFSKHLYMKRSGEPVHIYVPQAGSVASWL